MQFSITVPEQRDIQEPSSKTKLRLVAVGLVLLVAVSFGTFLYHQREPSYEGKTLSEWARELPDGTKEQSESAKRAIRHIGTNAIPYLLKWLQPPPPPSRAREWAWESAYWLSEHTKIQIHLSEYVYRGDEAVAGFAALGALGESAIPELGRRMAKNQEWLEALCLANIGTNSIPTLTNALLSSNGIARANALVALGKLGYKASSTAPLIEKLIYDPDRKVARLAIFDLGQFGPMASPYTSELEEMLRTNYEGDIAACALISLGRTVQILQELTNDSWAVRWNCAVALRDKIESKGPNFWLCYRVKSMWQASNAVSNTIMQANWKIMAMHFLQSFLLSEVPAMRAQAADDLGFLGVSAWPAVPALAKASADTNELVRQSVTNALKKIDVQFYEGGIVRGPRKTKRIALEFTGHTFAEGGETILNELAKHHQKASFFLTGDFLRNVEFRPLVQRIIKEGHYLGPHSDKHLLYCAWGTPKTTLINRSTFDADLSANVDKIVHWPSYASQNSIKFWLPAYEWYNQQISDWSKDMKLTLVNFTPGTRSNADYTQESDKNFVSSQVIFDSIVKKEREDPDGLNGFLLLMHLGAGPGRHDKMHEKFGALLDYLSAKGYQFVRIDELLD